MSYYERSTTTYLDGTPVFATAEDRSSEAQTARLLEQRWRCELRRYGELSPIDWFAVKDGRVSAMLELKTRSHEHDRYSTVFLNVRKWLALMLSEAGLGVPGLFVVRFSDSLYWARVRGGMGRVAIGGCREIVKARSDIEPVIHVPISDMRKLEEGGPNGT